jgi:hypothetical protein
VFCLVGQIDVGMYFIPFSLGFIFASLLRLDMINAPLDSDHFQP